MFKFWGQARMFWRSNAGWEWNIVVVTALLSAEYVQFCWTVCVINKYS